MNWFSDALDIRKENAMDRAEGKILDFPALPLIEVRCITPLQGQELDTYVDLLIEAETLADEIAALDKQLKLKRIKQASVDVKLQIINRSRT